MTGGAAWAAPAHGSAGLDVGEVHVWRFGLDPPGSLLARFEPTLHDDERRRADRFRTPTLRRRFVAGRGGLRAVLGFYLGCPAGEVAFVYGPHGKPALAGGAAGVEFNLAHTGDLALCAVARGGPVGVDVETVRPLDDAERIILRFFSPREQASFLTLPAVERLAAFYRAWARKEAFLKAKGTGLATQLDAFDVTLAPGEPAALLRVGDDPAEPARWSLRDLDTGPGFAAALAVSAAVGPGGGRVRLWDAGGWEV